ncbi:ATP-binding protein [Jidongwangia harbinensis]|uniref:ATP-binding protein n=1 Tax=Jidongwangia harbinensis TaxID=2878561 RepID=UPI001CDA3D90|nr:tetratricopeptide repeat protein [Jidongwangia harbinensis]MCA2216760.1 tetratricopeptide repeat protein [Jidongwangia harbinensis]
MPFAEAVRAHRLRCGLSQEDLASATGIAPRSIRNLEAGRVARPRPSTVRLLADAFRLTGTAREEFTALALHPTEPESAEPAAPGPDAAEPEPTEPAPVPAQLPRDTAGFVGRDSALRRLWTLLETNPGAVPVISGAGGVGKTTLAVHWAHQAADRFPDGQLYVNLRGFGPGGAMSRPDDVLADFLAALGVPRSQIPATTAARATLYRSTLARRRVLIVLDNARDAAQVRDLLPGAGPSYAVLTSRDRLTALIAADGAVPCPLEVLSDREAQTLLTRRLGADRVNLEPAAVAEITARCDRLPLALAVVAARCAVEPETSLATLADRLRRPAGVLDALSIGDDTTDVRAVFSWSYQALPERTRGLFRVLGLLPGPDLDRYAAANLAGLPLDDAATALTELVRLNLVVPRPAQRYGMHDLLRAYAAEVARHELSEAERRAALERLQAFYRHTLYELRDLLFPRGLAGPAPAPQTPMVFASAMERESWAESERANLVASVVQAARLGYPEYTDRMTYGLWTPFYNGGYSNDCLAISDAALHAARAEGDVEAEASALNHAAGALMSLGRYDETIEYGERALQLFQDLGKELSVARMYSNLAEVYTAVGRSRDAKRCGDESLAIRRQQSSPTVLGDALRLQAWLCLNLGLVEESLLHAAEALAKYNSWPDLVWERAEALNALAAVQLRLGLSEQAERHLRQALDVARPGTHGEKQRTETLRLLGEARRAAGAYPEADAHLSEALVLARSMGDPELITPALAERGLLRLAQGRIAEGLRDARDAVTISTDAGHRRCQMIAHNRLGELLSHTSDLETARRHARTALEIAVAVEDPYEQERARRNLTRLTA